MPSQSNTKLVSHIDCPGGGQVWVEGTTLYVGHMRPTSGTTIIDIADPRKPKTIVRIDVREGWHSHKVRVAGDIMIVNQEKFGKSSRTEVGGGIDIYDVSNPSAPKLITEWQPSERFVGTIVPYAWFAQGLRIVDYADPFAPREVGHYLPDAAPGADRAPSNDVTIDARGLIYLVDRVNGVDVIEAAAMS